MSTTTERVARVFAGSTGRSKARGTMAEKGVWLAMSVTSVSKTAEMSRLRMQ